MYSIYYIWFSFSIMILEQDCIAKDAAACRYTITPVSIHASLAVPLAYMKRWHSWIFLHFNRHAFRKGGGAVLEKDVGQQQKQC